MNAPIKPADIAPALAEYQAWARGNGLNGDQPPPFWQSVDHRDHTYGIDVNIELDEESGIYAAWVYPNRMNRDGWLETDTGTLLAAFPSTDWQH